MHEKVFIASGHLENFNDPLTECLNCRKRFRADKLIEDNLGINVEGKSVEELTEIIKENNIKCPECSGELSEVKWFNLMFPVIIGPSSLELLKFVESLINNASVNLEKLKELYEDYKSNTAYLRPETAQGPYILFKREFEVHRKKLPLGLAVIGRAFRNEISPRQLLIRLREFTQAELQIFFDPKEWLDNFEKEFNYSEIENKEINVLFVKDREKENYKTVKAKEFEEYGLPKFYVYFMIKVFEFYVNVLKIPKEKIRFKELSKEEKAFYNKYHFDIEYYFDCFNSWKEIAGVHYRTDHDLSGHEKVSNEKLKVKREDGSEFIPHVLELSFGVDRNILAIIDAFLEKEKFGTGERIVLKLPFELSPIKIAVFPLMSNKEELVNKAKEVYNYLKKEFPDWRIFYDEKGSIGKRYRRQDEIGTFFCVTIDYDTLKNDTVTVRFRDSMKQKRVKISELKHFFCKYNLH